MTTALLPDLARIAGFELLDDICSVLRPWDLRRVDADLATLSRLLPDHQLRMSYVRRLRLEGMGVIAELFAVARAATHADALVPHAAGRGSKTCDAKLTFGLHDYALEVKHQRDTFPFDGTAHDVHGAGTIYEGTRPGFDTRFVDFATPNDLTHKVPGSSIWRESLLDAADQLPRELPGIVALSVDAFGSELFSDLDDALLGDRVVVGAPSQRLREVRIGNGVFTLESFGHVTAVWLFRLQPQNVWPNVDDLVRMCLWARGHANHRARVTGVPVELQGSLPDVYETTPAESAEEFAS